MVVVTIAPDTGEETGHIMLLTDERFEAKMSELDCRYAWLIWILKEKKNSELIQGRNPVRQWRLKHWFTIH
jgi:hypothetical protein